MKVEKFFEISFRPSRAGRILFLANHFRYWTMSSWNRTTSFANKIKIGYLGLPRELESKALDVICASDEAGCNPPLEDLIRSEIEAFEREQEMCYTAYINGNSGGYLVLHEMTCDAYGHQLTSTRDIGSGDPEDYKDMTTDEIRELSDTVRSFDRMCDRIRARFIDLVETHVVVQKTVQIPKTISVLELQGEEACNTKN